MSVAAINQVRLPPAPCPQCGRVLSAATGVALNSTQGRAPRAGDVTFCMYCKVGLAFTEQLQLRLLTPDEWERLDPRLRQLVNAFLCGSERPQ